MAHELLLVQVVNTRIFNISCRCLTRPIVMIFAKMTVAFWGLITCFIILHVYCTSDEEYIAMPLLRSGWKENMSEDEAKALLETCMRTLYYRDCRTINRISFAKITATETVVSDPVCMETKWDFASFVRPKAGADSDGSW